MKIIVLGAGSFGCALANVLSDNGNTVTLWGHNKEHIDLLRISRKNPSVLNAYINKDIICCSDISLVDEMDMIVLVVPSFALRETAKKINAKITEKKTIVVATKGLEADTMASGHQIINEEIKLIKASVILSGPTHAEELAIKKFTTIVSTSDSEYGRNIVQKVFNCSYLRVYTNNDVLGVEILGAAKNVLAIAAGFCDGYEGLGDNAKAALMTRGLRELKLIGEAQGCNPQTFYGLTGLGDLIVTASSIHSRNRKFGELLGQGHTYDQALKEIAMVVEGIYSVKAIHQLSQTTGLDLPIITSIYEILYNDKTIKSQLDNLVYRQLKSEV